MKKNKNFHLDSETIRVFEVVEDIAINIIDSNGRFVCFSQGAELLDGMKREDVMGKHVLEVYKFYEKNVSPALRVLKNGEPLKDFSISYQNFKGRHVDAISSAYPVMSRDGKKIIGSMCIYRNKSDFILLSNRIAQLEDQLRRQSKPNNATRFQVGDIIGSSEALKDCIQQAELVSKISVPVLIYGETGTGKEVFAQSIHNLSARRNAPFVAVNCAAIPENLLESTLFGTVKGAFTGAVNAKGLLESAERGTIFLDEINSMNLMLQSKILRVLETGVYRRVGSTAEQKTQVQIISAMNEDPQRAIDERRIRADLFYRLAAFTIHLPPLRDRREDIIPLALSFLSSESLAAGKKIYDFSEAARKILYHYDWPGNVRELKHVVLRAILLCPATDSTISEQYFPAKLKKDTTHKNHGEAYEIKNIQPSTLKSLTENFERQVILKTLEENNHNITRSAAALGLIRQSLQYKMRTLGIQNQRDKKS